MRVAWLAPYPVQLLEPSVRLARRQDAFQSCSWIVHLSSALAGRQDIELHLVTESTLVPCDQVVESGGIVFHVLKASLPLVNRGFPPWLPLDVVSGFRYNVKRQVREIERIDPDVVHPHGTERAYAMAGVASGWPCVISIQGIISEYVKIYRNWALGRIARLEERTVQEGRYFIAQSKDVRRFLESVNPAARIFDIELPVDPLYFRVRRHEQSQRRILFVGSIEPRKGVPELIGGFADFCRDHKGYRLIVIGNGNKGFVAAMKELAECCGVGSQVEWRGFQVASQIARECETAALLVAPSRAETFCCVVAEGMAAGLPIVATNVAGIRSVLQDRRTGLLVESQAPEALASAMRELVDNPLLSETLGQQARATAKQRFDRDVLAARIYEVYQEVLAKEAPSPDYSRCA
jgi:glycosyltransferase involved in cell wall biosynthesis